MIDAWMSWRGQLQHVWRLIVFGCLLCLAGTGAEAWGMGEELFGFTEQQIAWFGLTFGLTAFML